MANWRRTWDIKQFLTSDPADFREVSTRIADYVERKKRPDDSLALDDIVDQLRDVAEDEGADVDDLDTVLEDLYDWADINGVWLGLCHTGSG